MNKVVRAKQCLQGDYGFKVTDEIFIVSDKQATDLEQLDLVEVIDDTNEEQYQARKGGETGFIFHPHQKAGGEKPAAETDHSNPTIG